MQDALLRWQTTQTSLRSGKESQLQPISLHFGQAISARDIQVVGHARPPFAPARMLGVRARLRVNAG
jgi:hypothetical protein